MTRRSLVALAVLGGSVLTACGASAPPAKELAVEVVDSLLADGTIDAAAAECMREKISGYEGDMLDDIADRAASDNADALESLAEFQADLAACR